MFFYLYTILHVKIQSQPQTHYTHIYYKHTTEQPCSKPHVPFTSVSSRIDHEETWKQLALQGSLVVSGQ
jgi:hypothetical protein